jgi:WhiB family redox-sensing transcriptional regulator
MTVDDRTRRRALDIYRREGATAAAAAVGVARRTVHRWAREAGVECGWTPPPPTAVHGTLTRYQRGCRCDDCRAANAARGWARRHDPDCDCVVCDLAERARDGSRGITAADYRSPAVRALDRRRLPRKRTAAAVESESKEQTMSVSTLSEDLIDDILHVARRHGTQVAAEWGRVTRFTAARLRRDRDGYVRGLGAPTMAEIEARAPSVSCPCPRCADWRAETQTTSTQTPPAEGAASEGWWADAACRGHDIDTFFPRRGESAIPAREICAGCSVNAECLDYALANGIHYGVWGGKSERQRRGMRRAIRMAEPVDRLA